MSLRDFWNPPAKRVKLSSENSNDEYSLEDTHSENDAPRNSSILEPSGCVLEPVKEDDSLQEHITSSQTQLESSLAPISADSGAISKYETENRIDKSSQNSHAKQEWAKGESSIYVDAFNLALDSVMKDEAHLFDDAEKAVFNQWKQLSYPSQYLYVLELFHQL